MKKALTAILAAIISIVCLFAAAACKSASNKISIVEVDLSSEEYGFAIKKGNDELLSSVNAFFKEKADDISEIFDKYTADGADLNSFGKEIQTQPTDSDNELVVATNLDFAPFEYTVGDKIAGIDMEIAQLLADHLGKTLVVVHMEFDAVVTSVQTIDTYDIGIAGLTITPERAELVNFSDPYFGAMQVILTKEEDTTFDGLETASEVEGKLATLTGDAAKCGGQRGSTSQFYVEGNEAFGFDGFSNLTFSAYKNAAVAVTDMLNGNISFVVVDKMTAQTLISNFNS